MQTLIIETTLVDDGLLRFGIGGISNESQSGLSSAKFVDDVLRENRFLSNIKTCCYTYS